MISTFLKSQDIFGHQVKLTLKHSNGTEQTSKLGGFVSLVLYAFCLIYFSIKFNKMINGDLDNITIQNDSIDDTMIQNYQPKKTMPYFLFESNSKDLFKNYTRTHLIHIKDSKVVLNNTFRECNLSDFQQYGQEKEFKAQS